MIHAKYTFITDRAVVGSWRFDKRAFLASCSNFWERIGLQKMANDWKIAKILNL